MLKKASLVTFSIFAIISIKAQLTTNTKVLQQASLEMKLQATKDVENLLAIATKKHWPLTKTNANGNTAVLAGIDAAGYPLYVMPFNNIVAAATTRANQLWPGGTTQLNLSGSSANMKNKLGVWDGDGTLGTHVELNGRVTQRDNAPVNPNRESNHATHVAGTMMASGVNPLVKGMAYGLQGIYAYDALSTTSNFRNSFSQIASEGAGGMILSNHSYGTIAGWYRNAGQNNRWEFWGDAGANEDYKFGYYSNDTQLLDSIAYNAPNYLLVFGGGNNRNDNGPPVGQPYFRYNTNGDMVDAGNRPAGISGNNGYDILPTFTTAKNILTIGAVNGLSSGYNRKEDVVMSSFSSWGPTDDGRIKPDLVADGVGVTSCIATGKNDYATYNGTSMAAPNATGSLLLLQEYYSKLKSGAFMRAATLKGLAIHTADEAGDNPGPDYKFGWGLLNVEKASDVIKAAITSNNAATSSHLIYEDNLLNGQPKTYNIIASGSMPLVATICWTDVKGNVDATNKLNNPALKLINDLDIRITKASNTYAPWILTPGVPTAAATTGDNTRDNVEQIKIGDVVPGQAYTIRITNKGTLARGAQAYSLIVSGAGGTVYCTSSPASNTGTRIDSVGFAGIANKNIGGCTDYKDYTNIIGQIEPNQSLPLTVKVSSCDATTANKIIKVFIDYNSNGSFNDAGELVASSAVIAGAGTFTTNVATPLGLTKGSYYLMRVIAQETSNVGAVNACGSYTNGETQDYRLFSAQPSNDIALQEIVAPVNGDCANSEQRIVVKIQNKGEVNKTNIPLTATVKNGASIIATYNIVCPVTVAANTTAIYTFQKTFTVTEGSTYSISVNANSTGDQDTSNNTKTASVVISPRPTGPQGTAVICGTSAVLRATNPDAGTSYFWYDSPAATTPIATGSTITVNTIPASKTFYLSTGLRGSVGIKTKNDFPGGGGYQAIAGNYQKYTANTPVILESVRLFTKYPGIINIELVNIVSEDSAGGYTQIGPLDTKPINVYSSHPTPQSGTVSNTNDIADTGAVYYVGMTLPSAGARLSYALKATAANGDTLVNIFRNNNISSNPYPFTVPNVFSVTGNSARLAGNANYYQGFYYYFYDMKIKTADCTSDRTAIIATTGNAVTISKMGDTLQTNAIVDIQWYLNGVLINGANGPQYVAVSSGNYTVRGTEAGGCTNTSASLVFIGNDVSNIPDEDINLKVSPNPNNGLFNVSFKVNTIGDLSLQLINLSGKIISTKNLGVFIGAYNDMFFAGNIPNGMYVLKVLHNGKPHSTKVLVAR